MLGQNHYYDPVVERCAGCGSRVCVLDRIPENTKETIDQFVLTGRPMGHFVTAVMENNLMEAFGRADEFNLSAMRDIVSYLYNEVPSGAWGSPVKVRLWQEAIELQRRAIAAEAEAEQAGA